MVKKGSHLSEETKKKIGLANAISLKGKHQSEETIKKRVETCKARKSYDNGKVLLGYKPSEETKKKISLAMMGNKNSHHPHPHSLESIEKIRAAKIGKLNPMFGMSGKKSPTWQGGISFEPYGIEFNNNLREQIRKRDEHRCQECFRHQNELNKTLAVHHIDFNKKNNNPSNLISLCTSCHSQTNYGREGWSDYFNNIMGTRGLK